MNNCFEDQNKKVVIKNLFNTDKADREIIGSKIFSKYAGANFDIARRDFHFTVFGICFYANGEKRILGVDRCDVDSGVVGLYHYVSCGDCAAIQISRKTAPLSHPRWKNRIVDYVYVGFDHLLVCGCNWLCAAITNCSGQRVCV